MKQITGGCACGAIRNEVTADPIVMFNCHCRDCQKTSGGEFYLPGNGFRITQGTLKYYRTGNEMMSDSIRGFCPECGSRLFGGKSDFGQGIAAGTHDNPIQYKPQHEIWISDTQPWDAMHPKLPKFEKYAPRG